MSTYRVADGHDVILGSLAVLVPQPRSKGIETTRRTFAPDGSVYDEGRFVQLEWTMLPDQATLATIWTAFGVYQSPININSNLVTVYVRDEMFLWVRMNGTAIRPNPGKDMAWKDYFPRQITIMVKDLVLAS